MVTTVSDKFSSVTMIKGLSGPLTYGPIVMM